MKDTKTVCIKRDALNKKQNSKEKTQMVFLTMRKGETENSDTWIDREREREREQGNDKAPREEV